MPHPDAGKIEVKGTYRRYTYVAMVGPMGALNGYVRLPRSHPWYQKHYSEELCGHSGCYDHAPYMEIAVHGGLTFSGRLPGLPPGFWYGFDCSHYDDLVPNLQAYGLGTGGTFKDKDYVAVECRNMIDQLITIADVASGAIFKLPEVKR